MPNSNKKEREEEILIGHKEQYDQIIHTENGEIFIRLPSGEIVRPDSVSSTLKHQRQSGKDKVITRLHKQATFDPAGFLTKYKHIFFIDTNIKVIHGREVSVATIIEVKEFKQTEVNGEIRVNLKKSHPWNIIFENATGVHGEKIAIALLVNRLKQNPSYPECLGLISDHELGNHVQYNKQELPLFDSFYLPNGYELAYASADKRTDTMLNRIITECDRHSTQLLNDFERSKKIIVGGEEVSLEGIPRISNRPIVWRTVPN